VAREMMLGIELTKRTPYNKVYFHGIIRDEHGQKISKSMENIDQYDPLNIIAQYGADPLRFTFISNIIPSKDLNLSYGALKASKNFCNKIWQSTNYILGSIDKIKDLTPFSIDYPKDKLGIADKWILSRFNNVLKNVNKSYKEYDYLNAARSIRSFFWDEFCDWYIEFSKLRMYNDDVKDKNTPMAVLLYILENSLRLLHPIMPFLTEALWQSLPDPIKEGPALIVAEWPEPNEALVDDLIEKDVELIKNIIHDIRRVRRDFNIKPGLNIPLIIQTGDKKELIKNTSPEITKLSHIDPYKLKLDESVIPKNSAKIVNQNVVVYLPLEKIIDLKVERERLSKQLSKLEENIQKIENKLDGPFSERAPPEIVKLERENLNELLNKKQSLKEQLEVLK